MAEVRTLQIPAAHIDATGFLIVIAAGPQVSTWKNNKDVAHFYFLNYVFGAARDYSICKKKVDYNCPTNAAFCGYGIDTYFGMQDMKTGPEPILKLYSQLGNVFYKRRKWIPGVYKEFKYFLSTPQKRCHVLALAPNILDGKSSPVILSTGWQSMEGSFPKCA